MRNVGPFAHGSTTIRRIIWHMITIRPAVESDLVAILDIYNDAILTTTAVYDYVPHTLDMRRDWFYAKQRDGFPVFVAEQDDVLGFAALGSFRSWAAYKYTVEHAIYVQKEARGLGIGGNLLLTLIDAAKQRGAKAMIAGVDADNVASYRLHQKMGFVEVAHFRQVGFKFGKWLDLKFLELLLEGPEKPQG